MADINVHLSRLWLLVLVLQPNGAETCSISANGVVIARRFRAGLSGVGFTRFPVSG
ncbi:hypothetical protein GCM10010873_14490 [Cypionkella aquatica]|uniref:Uncharacterized protein n=1 Tax=Cypionkella aquatica TaxID=1756042 RepID=A0AA37TVC8_9RHOB|nr:hypothetical protein [Cypionkella aquatica]GLS86475.1 hypothetical protein GCM10010873_14490 [Cypionkella aquatica]